MCAFIKCIYLRIFFLYMIQYEGNEYIHLCHYGIIYQRPKWKKCHTSLSLSFCLSLSSPSPHPQPLFLERHFIINLPNICHCQRVPGSVGASERNLTFSTHFFSSQTILNANSLCAFIHVVSSAWVISVLPSLLHLPVALFQLLPALQGLIKHWWRIGI